MPGLVHRLAVERSAGNGVVDELNHEGRAWSTVATVDGLVQPKRVTEVAQLNEAGAVVSDHTIFLLPVDLREADRIRFEPDDGRRYEVRGVRDAAGIGHHLEVDARMVRT